MFLRPFRLLPARNSSRLEFVSPVILKRSLRVSFFGLDPKVRPYFRSEASVSSRRQLAFRHPSLLMWTRPPFPLASWPKVPCLTLNEWRYSRAPKGRYLDRTQRAELTILSSQRQPKKSTPEARKR